jgi:hypothetical protein
MSNAGLLRTVAAAALQLVGGGLGSRSMSSTIEPTPWSVPMASVAGTGQTLSFCQWFCQ